MDWAEEKEQLFQILFPDVLDAVEEGMLSAADAIGGGIELDWSMLNAWADEFARTYTYELVKDITEASQALLQEKIDAWIKSGAHLDELIASLGDSGLYGEYRAFMIATTEVTRAFAEGNLEAWKKSGVVTQIQWMTATDEVVCEICGGLDGSIIDLGEAGFEGYSPNEEPNMVECPPAHVNCRCWMRPIWG